MKNNTKAERIFSTILGLIVVIGVFMYGRKLGLDKGWNDGVRSVKLEDLCIDPEPGGMSANFETGEYYEQIKCKVNRKNNIRVQDVFEPEGDWDLCDENAENCRPAARDGKWVE